MKFGKCFPLSAILIGVFCELQPLPAIIIGNFNEFHSLSAIIIGDFNETRPLVPSIPPSSFSSPGSWKTPARSCSQKKFNLALTTQGGRRLACAGSCARARTPLSSSRSTRGRRVDPGPGARGGCAVSRERRAAPRFDTDGKIFS